MLTDEQAKLLPDIYDAAVSSDYWPRALDSLVKGSEAKGAVLFASDGVGLPFSIQRASSVYTEEHMNYYMEHLVKYDMKVWDQIRQIPVQTLLLDSDRLADLKTLASRRDYAWMHDTIGVMRRGGARLNDSPGWTDSVALQYCSSMERVPKSVVKQAEALLPHLAKVVEVHRSFAILRAHYQAVLRALDRIQIGVCVTSRSGDIILANKEADRIFGEKDGLTVSLDKRFRCSQHEEAASLKIAIDQAIKTVEGIADAPHSSFSVTRKSEKYPLLVEVAPLSDSTDELDKGLKGAIIFIVDPENVRAFNLANVQRVFELTPVEAAVCGLMVQGLSDAEIAKRRSVSSETIKTQAKAIYRKTGTNRRTALIRLVLSITPPIEMPD